MFCGRRSTRLDQLGDQGPSAVHLRRVHQAEDLGNARRVLGRIGPFAGPEEVDERGSRRAIRAPFLGRAAGAGTRLVLAFPATLTSES